MMKSKVAWVFLYLVCLAPTIALAIWPSTTINFVLSDQPWNGWAGSLYGGYLFSGFIGTLGLTTRFIGSLMKKSDVTK